MRYALALSLTLSALASLSLSYEGLAHGVERGSIHQALKQERSLTDSAKVTVAKAVESRCDLKGGRITLEEAQVRFEEIDQGQGDTYFTVSLSVKFDDNRPSRLILVQGAEFEISNPSVERIEIFSIKSELCAR
jgi:hypothetical protein